MSAEDLIINFSGLVIKVEESDDPTIVVADNDSNQLLIFHVVNNSNRPLRGLIGCETWADSEAFMFQDQQIGEFVGENKLRLF